MKRTFTKRAILALTILGMVIVMMSGCGGGGGGGSTQSATHSISGNVLNGSGIPISGTIVVYSGTSSGQVTIEASTGNYTISGLAPGTYQLTPEESGYNFNPTSRSVEIAAANVSAINFVGTTGSAGAYTISGTVTLSGGSGLTGVTISYAGASSGSVNTNTSGSFTITGLAAGSYTLTPSKGGYTFDPVSNNYNLTASVSGVSFIATATSESRYKITGKVTDSGGSNLGNATISYTGPSNGSVTTNTSGNYTISDLVAGSYYLEPSKSGYDFSPDAVSRDVQANVSNVNFTATKVSTSLSVTITSPDSSFQITDSSFTITATIDSDESITKTRYKVTRTDGTTKTVCEQSGKLESCTWNASSTSNYPDGEYTISVYVKTVSGVEQTETVMGDLVVLSRLSSRWTNWSAMASDHIIPALQDPNNPPAGVYLFEPPEAQDYERWVTSTKVCVPMQVEIVEGSNSGGVCTDYDCTRIWAVVRVYFNETDDDFVYTSSPHSAVVTGVYQIEAYPSIFPTPPDSKNFDICN